MTFKFRQGKPSDAASCAKIIRAWATETPWMTKVDDLEPMAEYWRERFTVDPVWVAEEAGQIVGFCVREEDNIAALYVTSMARGQGVGKRLLDLAKENRDWITVWAYELNTKAREFYRREGLVEVSREPETYGDGITLVDVEHRWKRPIVQQTDTIGAARCAARNGQ